MEVKHLKAVYFISKYGSLTEAAKRLFLTQSAVSHQLKEFESLIDVKLFNRFNKRLEITSEGRIVVQYAEEILNKTRELKQILSHSENSEHETIRIALDTYKSFYWLKELLIGLNSNESKLYVELVDVETEMVNALHDNKIDIFISFEKISDPHLNVYKFHSDQLVAVMSPNHNYHSREFIDLEDLYDQTIITHRPNTSLARLFEYTMDTSGFRPGKMIHFPSTETLIQMVKANMGITVLSLWPITPYLGDDLVVKPITERSLPKNWYIITRRENKNALLKAFIDTLLATKSEFSLEDYSCKH